MTTEREAPRFTGVAYYDDPKGRFRFRFPTDWERYDLEDDREGRLFAPNPDDLQTYFAVWVTELEQAVVAEDLDDLMAGVADGLAQLPSAHVESGSEACMGNLIKFERVLTFSLDGKVAKRKTWILYVDRWTIVLTWQGSTEEEYEHWLAMANYGFATFNVAEELWFATDRDLGFVP